MVPEFLLVFLLFALVAAPLLIGATVLLNRRDRDNVDEEVEELKQRVEELESEQN
jgi:signal transduction histidine kinase